MVTFCYGDSFSYVSNLSFKTHIKGDYNIFAMHKVPKRTKAFQYLTRINLECPSEQSCNVYFFNYLN